ncbi:MAG: cytidylate kinase family protein, partial [Candidatus Paceibacterota bacterium]
MKITICGLAGTGTSTTGKKLASVLEYEFISSGGIFRAKAAEYGMDLHEFEDLCRSDEKYDRAVDDEIATIGKSKDDIVVESRLAWYFIPDSFKVLLVCDRHTRVSR